MANTKRTIEEILKSEQITPYEVFRLWQDAIDKLNIDRQLKPQMAYNYDRNGLIVKGRKALETGEAGRYTVTEAYEFIARWLLRNYKIEFNFNAPTTPTESDECEGQEELFAI